MRAAIAGLMVLLCCVAARGHAETVPTCKNVPMDSHRVAMVIGNSEYVSSPRLPNAAHDSNAIRKVLQDCLGFTVIYAENQSRDGMIEMARKFEDKLSEGALAVFYYAGHAVEADGLSDLMPPRHNIHSLNEIPDFGYPLQSIAKVMEKGRGDTGTSVIVLDACRDNPFPSAVGTMREATFRGLAPPVPMQYTLYMFSTKQGGKAMEQIPNTTSYLSPFTTALVSNLVRPELSLRDLPDEVSDSVQRLTGGQQQPWSDRSSVPAIHLARAGIRDDARGDKQLNEIAYWNTIGANADRSLYKVYLDRVARGEYPGTFVSDARKYLQMDPVHPQLDPCSVALTPSAEKRAQCVALAFLGEIDAGKDEDAYRRLSSDERNMFRLDFFRGQVGAYKIDRGNLGGANRACTVTAAQYSRGIRVVQCLVHVGVRDFEEVVWLVPTTTGNGFEVANYNLSETKIFH
jgi:caspase domain-containing protein